MSKISDILALDKWQRVIKIIVDNGGIIRSFYKFWRFDTLKDGRVVGKDSFGNTYYQNDYYMIARNRWVEHHPMVKWEYDASQITPEWYGWLHNRTDLLPHEDPAKQCLKCCCWTGAWMAPHEENWTGTEKAFYPFSTTRPHIKIWDGSWQDRNVCMNRILWGNRKLWQEWNNPGRTHIQYFLCYCVTNRPDCANTPYCAQFYIKQ